MNLKHVKATREVGDEHYVRRSVYRRGKHFVFWRRYYPIFFGYNNCQTIKVWSLELLKKAKQKGFFEREAESSEEAVAPMQPYWVGVDYGSKDETVYAPPLR